MTADSKHPWSVRGAEQRLIKENDPTHATVRGTKPTYREGSSNSWISPIAGRHFVFSVVTLLATPGLVAKDGVVDLSHDHLDTIEYVARRYVETRFPEQTVTFEGKDVLMATLARRHRRYCFASPPPRFLSNKS
jgi:hypothetical protein